MSSGLDSVAALAIAAESLEIEMAHLPFTGREQGRGK